jgi:flavin reductase (DIM6/NTAB) family NADH-FMN oxidoreductase RutF
MLTQPVPDHLKMTVGKALGRVPSGVFIMTTRHGGQALVMMASWVQQAAFNPPAVSIAMQKDRPMRQALQGGASFALAVVGEGDTSLMKKYARGIPPGQDPFEGVESIQTPAGLMVPAAALAWLECSVLNALEFGGDHELVVARVTDGAVLREGTSFMHVRGNGFHY